MSYNIEVEGDSTVVIGWMRNGSGGPWRFFIYSRKRFFWFLFENPFKWIPREANEEADRLAKRGVEKEFIFVGSLEEERLE